MKTLHTIALVLLWSLPLFAQRIVVDREMAPQSYKPVYLKALKATISVNEGAAKVTLEQIFHNPSPVQLEGEYIFALPAEAEFHDFQLYINGRKTRGQLLDAKEAAAIYTDIVRKLRDPALLEYAGRRLFKARVFPLPPNGDRKIELSYSQVVSYASGTHRFVLPIRQTGQGRIEDFEMKITLQAKSPLANIYSPSHDIDIDRRSDRSAEIRLKTHNLPGDRDFLLYYDVANKEVNATMLTFRPRTDRDGYFMLLAEPAYQVTEQDVNPKDIIFVVDVSGSMAGEKIEQVKEALRYCVNSLRGEDRFEVISFSTRVEKFQGALRTADKDAKENALYFIDNLSAAGGTNIDGALKEALRLKDRADDRPTSIIFLTDGLPTEGERDVARILQNIESERKDFIRIFNFGVGYDVNTFLLDKLAADHHGSADYVRPGENIESRVSEFFAQNAAPVLTNAEFDFGSLRVYDVYPQKLPDIFKGQRVTLLGRYRTAGKSDIQLSGNQRGDKRTFTYSVELPRREMANEFIAKLWANRKVADLLEQIRFNGENQELVASVKAIGNEYGIVTPYTSYLVTEEKKELILTENRLAAGQGGAAGERLLSKQSLREEAAGEDDASILLDYLIQAATPTSVASGKNAVLASMARKKMARDEQERDVLITVQNIAGRTFYLRKGVWVENGLKLQGEPDKMIAFASEEYFELSMQDPLLRRIMALGEQVVFKWQNKVYKITSSKT